MNSFLEAIEHVTIIMTSLIAVASTITAVTNTPSHDGIKGYIYKIIEFLALVTDRTKQQ
ncbi:MAG: hypothetical protein ACJARD_001737 [Alphaproteobacteria bacterium]|jgi:hypothetical protein